MIDAKSEEEEGVLSVTRPVLMSEGYGSAAYSLPEVKKVHLTPFCS